MLDILKAMGVGPKIRQPIKIFWQLAVIACKAWVNFGTRFKAGCGVTQGGSLSARLFNLVVSCIVWDLLWQLEADVGDGAAEHGLGDVVRALFLVYYVDDGFVASRDPALL